MTDAIAEKKPGNSSVIDSAGAVREGESIDPSQVHAFLAKHIEGLSAEPSITQFSGGASNLTYLLSYPDQEFILRRPPFGKIPAGAHDMGREYRIMETLQPHYPCVPSMVAMGQPGDAMETEFYVMERMVGIIPRKNMPKSLQLDEPTTSALCKNVLDKFIELHQIDYTQTGMTAFSKGEGYVKRQIGGWSARFEKSKTDDASDFSEIMAWLHEKMPADTKQCIIHNDFRLDNVVLNPENPSEVIGVLDWEMATIGDPLMDLGNSLAYWIEANDPPTLLMMRRQPTHLPGMFTRQEVIEYYGEKTGLCVDNFDFYQVYGIFRLAVILQQIYYRFYHGQTKNPEFGMFIHAINFIQTWCLDLINKSKL